MEVKNVSSRGWWVGDKFIAPLQTVELDNSFLSYISGNQDLYVIPTKDSIVRKRKISEKTDLDVIQQEKDVIQQEKDVIQQEK